MYIGKHAGGCNEARHQEPKPIHIPENYAGNAFASEIVCEPSESPMPKDVPCTHLLCAGDEEEKQVSHTERLFSSDTLLVFLAILLFGSEGGGELSLILLLLLLF